jgi:DNA invertase Pin-like site-specific DNA recombinase
MQGEIGAHRAHHHPDERRQQDLTSASPMVTVGVTALGYARVAGDVGDPGAELRAQRRAIEAFCAARGWTLAEIVCEAPRLVGRQSGRPSLEYAFERLRRGEATGLVVSDLKYLSRSVAELGPVLEAIDEVGARLVALEPGIDTGTRFGRASLRVLMSLSTWERGRRERMTAAARARVTSRPTIDDKLKRRIRRMRAAGMTLQAISDELNSDSVPTPRGGAEWRPSSVQASLGYRRPRW